MHFLAPSEGESKVPLSCHISEILSQIQLHLQDHLTWHNWGYPSNFGHWLVYDYTQSINGLTILTIISIHILPSYLTWSNHFITELTNHFPFVIQPRSQAFAAATLDLVRHENFKLPNFSDTADFRKLSENSRKILKMELVWIGVFTSKFRLRNGVVQRVWV